MCEIFMAKSADGGAIQDETLANLFHVAVKSSRRNSDGFGIWNKQKDRVKDTGRFTYEDASELFEEFKGSEHVVLHLRLKTQGAECAKNSHPFVCGDNIMCHNGVLTQNDNTYNVTDNEPDTDSYEFLKAVVNKDETETVEQIKHAAARVKGSMSIFLQDDEAMYYFRDSKPFTFGRIPETGELIGATDGDRLDQMFPAKKRHVRRRTSTVDQRKEIKTQDPQEGKIYRVEGGQVTPIDTFEVGTETSTPDYDDYYNGGGYRRPQRQPETSNYTETEHPETELVYNAPGGGSTPLVYNEDEDVLELKDKNEFIREGGVITTRVEYLNADNISDALKIAANGAKIKDGSIVHDIGIQIPEDDIDDVAEGHKVTVQIKSVYTQYIVTELLHNHGTHVELPPEQEDEDDIIEQAAREIQKNPATFWNDAEFEQYHQDEEDYWQQKRQEFYEDNIEGTELEDQVYDEPALPKYVH